MWQTCESGFRGKDFEGVRLCFLVADAVRMAQLFFDELDLRRVSENHLRDT